MTIALGRPMISQLQSEFRSRAEIWVFLTIALAVKLPDLSYPFFWDEGVYIQPAFWLQDHGLYRVLPGLHPPELFFGHTPGFSFLLALVFKIFGRHIEAARSVAMLCSFSAVYFTYRLAELLSGRWAGICAAILLFLLPTYYAHSTQVVADIALVGVGTAALFFAFTGKYRLYFFTGSIAALMKETSAAYLASIFAFGALRIFFFERDLTLKSHAGKLAYLALPTLVLLLFFILEFLTTGKFSNFPFIHTLDLDPFRWLSRSVDYGRSFFWDFQKMSWVTALACAGAGAVLVRPRMQKRPFMLACLLSVVACFWLGISLLNWINARYFIPAYPILFILAAVALRDLLVFRPLILAFTILIGAQFIPQYHGSGSALGHGWEETMQFREVVQTHSEAARYLQRTCPNAKILASWPLISALTEPSMGYVDIALPSVLDPGPPLRYEVILLTENSEPDRYQFLLREIVRRNMILRKRFARNGKFAEIWVSGNPCVEPL